MARRRFEVDDAAVDDLTAIRRQLGVENDADVLLRAVELMKVAIRFSRDGVVTILTPDGKTLPVKLAGK